MTGFMTGAALLIMLGQLNNLTGYHVPSSSRLVIIRALNWLANLPKIDPHTTLIGLVALALIYNLLKTRFKSLASLLTIFITALWVHVADWETVRSVQDMSQIASGLPHPVLPSLRLAPDLWTIALAAAVLGLVQSAGISRQIAQPDGSLADTSRDFFGQGMGNLLGGIFQGMPAGGSLARTAVNLSAGAKTRWANAFAGVFMGLILLVFGQWVERITLTTLAAHLIIATSSLISPAQIRMVWQIDLPARLSMLATFLATLFMPLEYSIYIGVGLSIAMYAYSSSSNIRVKELIPLPDGRFRECDPPKTLISRHPLILAVYGNLYFAAINTLEQLLPKAQTAEMPVVIIRLKGNNYMGSTGIQLFEKYQRQLASRGGRLILTGISPVVAGHLERTGATLRLGKENIFMESDILLNSTREGLESAQKWLADQSHKLDSMEV